MSEYIEIVGGIPLHGKVRVGGAKNAVLPMLIASLLSPAEIEFDNVPALEDVGILLHLLEHFGATTEYVGSKVKVSVPTLTSTEASYSLVKALRASFWVLAPLLARGHSARVSLPGGDLIGARPVDIHLECLAKMGADISMKHGVVFATAPQGLKPAELSIRFPSVGATHQVLMAAALTPGTTVLRGAAREPEVIALAEMLTAMGADIEGAGSDTIVIRGVTEMHGAKVSIIGDRIEAGTFLLAGAATNGEVTVEGVKPEYFGSFLQFLSDVGLSITTTADTILVRRAGPLKPVHVATAPFPGFATDLQAQVMALLCLAEGTSTIEENIYEGRFRHASELVRMGADIKISDRVATINGVSKLAGAPVEATDIRAGACLAIAGLSAEGNTAIFEPQHLRRGYEHFETKLRKLGAKAWKKLQDPEDFAFTGC